MTTREHALMISMFAMLLEAQHSMIDALKSRGILENDDMLAFWSVRQEDVKAQTMERARAVYALLAKSAGLDIGGLSAPIKL